MSRAIVDFEMPAFRRAGKGNIVRFLVLGIALALAIVAPRGATAQDQGPRSVADLAERLQDAVVNISTTQTVKGSRGIPLPKVPKGSPFEDFFEDFFNKQQRSDRPRRVNSLGSGFVIDASGIIVTNNHVIESADEIYVNFSDDTKLKVEKILGTDPKTDIALLKVNPEKPLTALAFGDSAKMRVGDWVMAIGNPFGLGGTVTLGIISAKKRDINSGPYDEFIQTDAAINRGNSGGPLFDMEGKVIGVNTAIISPTGGSIGIGFAVPSNTATYVINQLREFGEIRRGWLGVRIQTVTDGIAESLGMDKPMGALVAAVTPDSPADKAGVKVGDVILEFDGKDVESMKSLPRLVARTKIGSAVDVVLLRNDKKLTESKKVTVQVEIGKLAVEEASAKKEEEKSTEEEEKMSLLGLSISGLTGELRTKYKVDKDVNGVVITGVEPDSDAARKGIAEGNVIVEVRGAKVDTPEAVAKEVEATKKSKRKSVLLMIADSKGDLRFVAVSVE